jgi:tRNA A37 threonylcarbamoyladenosine synthetase subunit TsaC/SUA5/YrdC
LNIEPFVLRAYQAIVDDGLVVFPTDVGYALLGHSDPSMQLMYHVKRRPLNRGCVVICNHQILCDVAKPSRPVLAAIRSITMNWPCAFVLPARVDSHYFANLGNFSRLHVISSGNVAVFLNTGPWAAQLVALSQKDARLIIGSSANLSNAGNNYRFETVEKEIKEAVQVSCDGGPTRYSHPNFVGTTIVNFVTQRIQRQGIFFPEIYNHLAELGFMLNPGIAEKVKQRKLMAG